MSLENTHNQPAVDIRRPVPWSVSIMLVSPERAASWLKYNNPRNRRLKEATVAKYTRNILNGHWKLSPQAVIFDTNGSITNGQHRLAAIVRAGIPTPIFLVEDTDPALFDIYDLTTTRNAADIAYIQGKAYATQFNPAYALLFQYRTGVSARQSSRARATTPDIVALNEEEPGLEEWFGIAHNALSKASLNRTVSAVAMYLVSSENPHLDQSEFIEGVTTGANLSSDDPRLHLRNRAMLDRHRKTHNWERLATFIKAWNAWATNQPMKALRFQAGEAMPAPVKLMSGVEGVA